MKATDVEIVFPAGGEEPKAESTALAMAGMPEEADRLMRGVKCMFCGGSRFYGRRFKVKHDVVPVDYLYRRSFEHRGFHFMLEFDCLDCRTTFTVEKDLP